MLQVFEGFEPYLVTKGQHDADVNSHHHANPVDTMVVNMTGESSCGPVALPKTGRVVDTTSFVRRHLQRQSIQRV